MTEKRSEKTALEVHGGELPALTPQQLKFVEGLLAGKTASDAYRAAYDCSKMKQDTVWAEASRLRSSHKVAAWVSLARQAHLGAGTVTLENHLRELERIKELAIETKQYSAAAHAEHLRGKASGHYVDMVADVTFDPIKTLNEIAAVEPAIARRLADAYSIPWNDKPETEH